MWILPFLHTFYNLAKTYVEVRDSTPVKSHSYSNYSMAGFFFLQRLSMKQVWMLNIRNFSLQWRKINTLWLFFFFASLVFLSRSTISNDKWTKKCQFPTYKPETKNYSREVFLRGFKEKYMSTKSHLNSSSVKENFIISPKLILI